MSPDPVRFSAFAGEATLIATSRMALDAALPEVRRTVDEFDRACSRFRCDSEISALHRASDDELQPVSEVLAAALETALRAAHVSGGDVDPTVGGALLGLGYDCDFAALRPGRPIKLVGIPGWRRIDLDPAARTARIPAGVSVDLGATAKALAADWAARRAYEAGGPDAGVLVSFSGDIATAGPPPEGGWNVRVTDDHRAGLSAPGQSIRLSTGALATSSTTVRRWRTAEGDAHHVIDPRTGRPTTGPWRTVSVTAATCVDANIASTASLVRGESAEAWLEELELPARLVTSNGEVRHLAGWPTEGDDLS